MKLTSELLKQQRKKIGISQKEMSKKVGLHRVSILHYEQGKNLGNLNKLLDAYDLELQPKDATALTEEEKEYLSNSVFWDWKRAEIDLWYIKYANPDSVKDIEEKENFYRKLYEKLGGQIGLFKKSNY